MTIKARAIIMKTRAIIITIMIMGSIFWTPHSGNPPVRAQVGHYAQSPRSRPTAQTRAALNQRLLLGLPSILLVSLKDLEDPKGLS